MDVLIIIHVYIILFKYNIYNIYPAILIHIMIKRRVIPYIYLTVFP